MYLLINILQCTYRKKFKDISWILWLLEDITVGQGEVSQETLQLRNSRTTSRQEIQILGGPRYLSFHLLLPPLPA